MISAVVYSSGTGSSQRYARALSDALQIPAYECKGCPTLAGKGILYVGWVMADGIQGYKAAAALGNVRAVVRVGMGAVDGVDVALCRKKNALPPETKLFCLQGAFHMGQLSLPLRAVMKIVTKDIAKRLHAKAATAALNEQELACLRMAETGEGEPASWDGIQAVVEWARNA